MFPRFIRGSSRSSRRQCLRNWKRKFGSFNKMGSSIGFRGIACMAGMANEEKGNRSARIVSTLVAAGVATALMEDYRQKRAKACGIVAYIGQDEAVKFLLEGLLILQNRGYDSAGISTVDDNKRIITTKYASSNTTSDCIDTLKNEAPGRHAKHKVGVAHTRWATHGGKTDENAHPHNDMKNRVALVHNGTIENSHDLKKELESKGIAFKSQTDTEVIAQLIGWYMDNGDAFLDAFKRTLNRLEGTWGIACIHNDEPGKVVAARNGSPLVVGIGDGCKFIASEVSAFSRHTSQYISLHDGEIAIIEESGISLDENRIEIAPQEEIELDPSPFSHWTIKEIMEQPEAISRTLNYGARFDRLNNVKLGGLDDNADTLLPIKHLMLSACGTSLFASMYGALLMQSIGCFDTVHCIDAAEVTNASFPLHDGGLLVVSQSGETKDTHRSLETAREIGLPVLSVVNRVGSLIARTTNCGVYINAGREHAVASTKAFTTQVTALALVAGWFSQNRHDTEFHHRQGRQEMIEAIHRLPVYSGMTLQTHDTCKAIANKLVNKQHLFILGKGFAEPIAREGALKIKEITYVHAEGLSGGALKHGPFALLEEGTPVVLIILNDRHAELMRIAAEEVRARGAKTIIITDKPSLARGVADDLVIIPSNGPLTALLAAIPLQMIAYELALAKGINPDKPKNLAKAVTVD